MKELELLIDKCLHGEASEQEENHLKELISESDEALEFYFKSIQQHSDLQEWAEAQEIEETKIHKFPRFQRGLAIVAILVMAFVLFMPSGNKPELYLTIHSVSSNYKLIRQGEMLKSVTQVKQGDQILVGDGGQVRLDVEGQQSQLFLMSNSSVNFINRDCNKINLQQGEIRAKLEKQKTPFIIKTNEGVAEIIGTEFSLTDKGATQLWVTSGKVKLNRGKKDSVFVGAGQRIDTESFRIEDKSGEQLIPQMCQGVEYFYYRNPNKTLSLDSDMTLIDHGIRSGFTYFTGAYDGYVRAAPTNKSYVSSGPFLMVLKAHYNTLNAGAHKLQVNRFRKANLRVNEKLYKLNEQGQADVHFKEGFNLVELRTIGGKEDDTGEVLVDLKINDGENLLSDLPKEQLFYSTTTEIPDLTDREMEEALTCDLPLREDFRDRVNGAETEVRGEPGFVNDPEMGSVLELNGKSDFLRHLKADELGLNGSYTVACRVYFSELMKNGRPDDGLFSTDMTPPVEGNSTLVLLIRRKHPYMAHFANDTVSSQVLEAKRWYDLAFRFDNGVQSIFVNGELVTSSQGHGNLYSREEFQIGTWGGNFMKGRICDVKVFNAALSIKNISEL
jgi:hypothetical protein